ncbi:2OG-Fe dioxygenase family protein [Aeromonas hydrophila]|nr:2OG-Fe dioxygenase family protein [Aeromonas hydrophila]MDM5117258.1 2OG-Fe dioxygenase family protein [Aeromonas hydrophila]
MKACRPPRKACIRTALISSGCSYCGSDGVSGGALQLYHGLKEQPFFQQQLNAGEYLILDDRRFYHNAAPILPQGPHRGHWDVIVLTA